MAIVIVIILIFGTMLIPVYSGMRARSQKVQCITNLRSLYVAADLYVQRNGNWPQIKRSDSDSGGVAFANAWIAALSPFGPTHQTWICPAIQELLHNPDYTKAENARLDYYPMSFDDKPTSPHRWARQPWFIETSGVHGNGNLIIFTDGSVSQSNDLQPK